MPASLFAGTAIPSGKGDTLGPDNGGDSGSDYSRCRPPVQSAAFRRAAPRPIHRLRWYRISTLPRLSGPRFDDYYS